jgi:hypothetical protein
MPRNTLTRPERAMLVKLHTCWRAAKACTHEALDAALPHALATIPESDARAWFAHSGDVLH